MSSQAPGHPPRDGPQHDELKAKIVDEARRLGFELVGVTTPDTPAHLDVYERWLDQGRHGQMGYLETERARKARADLREILPECKSVLVVGANYLPPEAAAAAADSPVKVAAYALGQDYHEVLLDRLRKLVDGIQHWVGHDVPHKIYTDTAPILERELAQRAGLGWIGKNTCLINPEQGSYFLLAEVLLGLELEPDSPILTDHCGTCTRCIEACPTDCILPDRTLDARRCISYLTIELKEGVPSELRGELERWVFGCDICQQVCPWNERFAEATSDPAFQPRPFLRQPQLYDFLELDVETYRQQFKNSPLKRPKLRGLLRNAALAAANGGRSEAIPHLTRLLEHSQPLVRGHAAWAIGQLGGEDARTALERAARQEDDEGVQVEIDAALQKLIEARRR